MKIDEIKGAKVKPKETMKVEAFNALEIILTKDDLGEMINAMEDAYNNMGNTHNANLLVEGSGETGFIYYISYTWTNSGATTPFH